MILSANRYHDFSAGHRVAGHENKCAALHGHNYRVHFYCEAEDSLDDIGRVIDFSVIKSKLCMWLEENWDHRTLLWVADEHLDSLLENPVWAPSIVVTAFNPTAENMASYLLEVVGPQQLEGTGVILTKVVVEETRKCSATAIWQVWAGGYTQNPADVLKVFEDGGEDYDEMIIVRGIPFYSHCEHHLAPFFGTADIGYVPNGRIVGLSKLSRLLDIFARRLQVQERLTAQVADALMDHLQPKGAAVVVRARHLCMESRGIQKQGSETVTQIVRGVFFDDPKARNEFLGSIK